MRHLKLFEEFIEEGIAKKAGADHERAKSLILESERKFRSLKRNLEKVGIDDDNANDYVEYCYDILLFLIRAKLYLDGYSCSGISAHEAEVSYTRNLSFEEPAVQFLDQLRYFRNGILYYGKRFDKEYAEKVIAFTKKNYAKIKQMTAL